jgi:hypothetical protein
MILTGRRGLRRMEASVKHSVARKARGIAKSIKREAMKRKHRIARTAKNERPRGI